MRVNITRAKTMDDIEVIAALAREIWTQHFTPIIGESQVEYMLMNFQSVEAITSQLSNGLEYYLAEDGNKRVGYTGLVPDLKNGRMQISKIYIKDTCRGKSIGSSVLDFIERKCAAEKITTLWLTVNRLNQDSIAWYKHHGFEIVAEVKKDIGEGFFMDDYIMEKPLHNS